MNDTAVRGDSVPAADEEKKAVIFLTGAAGYVGAMLAYQWVQRPDVALVIALDKDPIPEFLRGSPKIHYIQGNTADDFWEDEVRALAPTVVVHAAWQIRSFYGRKGTAKNWQWNIVGSQHVFEFACEMPSVERLVHFSTVASFGAFSSNTLDHFFNEEEPLRKSPYAYAEEKRISEDVLKEELSYAKQAGRTISVYVVRPASITGPRAKSLKGRFGLQSALSGSFETRSIGEKLVSLLLTWMPATRGWVRQYIHEDDVVDAITLFALDSAPTHAYGVFHLCPPGAVVRARDMAAAVGKKVLPVSPWMVRAAFFLAWHLSLGKIPTSPGSWRGYSYPILVDGSKITRTYGFKYRYEPLEAFRTREGRAVAFIDSLKFMTDTPARAGRGPHGQEGISR